LKAALEGWLEKTGHEFLSPEFLFSLRKVQDDPTRTFD
jgi:hypothetical protein